MERRLCARIYVYGYGISGLYMVGHAGPADTSARRLPTLREWAYTLYIEWAKTDGVDQTEVERNNEVYKIQGNRNPFVDFPTSWNIYGATA